MLFLMMKVSKIYYLIMMKNCLSSKTKTEERFSVLRIKKLKMNSSFKRLNLLKERDIEKLDLLKEEAAVCVACNLHKNRIKSVFAKGSPQAKIVFIAEAPGQTENI